MLSLVRGTGIFTIEGRLLGYRASVERHDREYRKWKEAIRWQASGCGVPTEIPSTGKLFVGVIISWKRAPRIDWKNVVGAIEDAIFVKDRRIHPGPHAWEENTGIEQAVVTVRYEP